MVTINVAGFEGTLVAKTNLDAANLSEELLHAGYDVRIAQVPVRIEYGPGYDLVVWADGEAAGLAVTT
jgi:hypothetical protein